jgi:NADH:ubiquinone oxidoreductase subunit 3 (subunit A)
MELCRNYSNIKGLTIDIEPCFYNYFDDIGGFYCATVSSVMNTRCENIKTNKNVGDNNGPKYCDNAQFLFKIDGKGFGCKWKTNECIDAVLEEDDLPEDCSGYMKNESCNYHITRKGKSCFWNPVKNDENDTFCTEVDDIEACDNICTNDLSGINTYFCNGNFVITDSTSEMCRWGIASEEIFSGGCYCEGVDIPEKCTLLNVSSPSECKQFISVKGKCFYNGDDDDEVMGIGVCIDIGDIMECGDFLDQTLCMYAKKHTYYNLENYSSASSAVFLCIWNAEEGGICQSKKLGNLMNSDKQKMSTWVLIVIIVVGVVILVVLIVVLLLILRKAKSYSSNKKREYEMSNFSKNLEDSRNEYMIGEIIEQFQIEKIIGRGVFKKQFILFYLIRNIFFFRVIWCDLYGC